MRAGLCVLAVLVGETVYPQKADELWPPVFLGGEVRFGLRRGRELFVKTLGGKP